MKKTLILFLFLSTLCAKSQSNYEITINLKNCKDTIAFLTYYQLDKNYIKDTCTSIKNGKIIFKGNGKLDKGIYSLVGQQKSIYFDFFIDDDTQKLEIKNELSAENIDGLIAVNSPRENEFFDYIKFINKQNKEFVDYKNSIPILTKKDTLLLDKKQEKLNELIQTYENNFYNKNKGFYIGDVINLKIVKLLKENANASKTKEDQVAIYEYYKSHYWDNVDFEDDATMRNPFFFPKLKNYFESVVVKHPDSVCVEVDTMLSKTKPNSLFYKLLLAHLTYSYETSKIMGFDIVFVHIVDKYFKTGKAEGIYEDDVVQKIIKRAETARPLLVGAKAPDLSMIKASDGEAIRTMGFENAKSSEEVTKIFYKNETLLNKMFYHLNAVSADFTILVFWDVDCGHCQKEIPKLADLYNKFKKENKNIKVFSVYTLHEIDKYTKYINEHQLNDWINVYDGAHYNNINVKYDVTSTPVIYILDKNKIIKAKRIGVEQIENIITELEKQNKK
jgi:thiol-disulfide isomerase/thioredoxin